MIKQYFRDQWANGSKTDRFDLIALTLLFTAVTIILVVAGVLELVHDRFPYQIVIPPLMLFAWRWVHRFEQRIADDTKSPSEEPNYDI